MQMNTLQSLADDECSPVTNQHFDPHSTSDDRNNNCTTSPVSAACEPLLKPHSSNEVRQKFSGASSSAYRLVDKNGHANVWPTQVQGRLKRYVFDFMTSLTQLPFYYHVAAFFTALFISWTLFGLLWWLMAAVNGDLMQEDEWYLLDERSDTMCTHNVYDFASALLYSVETQTTLGYGSRVTNPSCAQSLTLVIVQLVVGVAIDCVIAGLVFDKLTRPQRRTKMTWFSRNAVVFRRHDDGSYCLALRVWYRGTSPLLSATVKAVFIRNSDRIQSVNDIPNGFNIQLDPGFAVFPWPETVVHTIDSSSPLWNMSADDINNSDFELIVIIEGTVESTAVGCQYMTSYKSSEIIWGHVFAPLALTMPMAPIDGQRSFMNRFRCQADSQWMIDSSLFNQIVTCDAMPDYSAKHASKTKQLPSKTPNK